ncbi:MAG: hypothetical protein ABIY90_07550 [Puia sp.]
MYYPRTQAASRAVQFTLENQGSVAMEPVVPNGNDDVVAKATCSMKEGCISCSA